MKKEVLYFVNAWRWNNAGQDYNINMPCSSGDSTFSEFKQMKKAYKEKKGKILYELLNNNGKGLDSFYSNQEMIF